MNTRHLLPRPGCPFLFLLIISLYLSGCTPFAGETPYTVYGIVVDANGEGIEGVTIYFSNMPGTAVTDEYGMWTQANLKGLTEVTPVFATDNGPYVFFPGKKKVHKESTITFSGYPQRPIATELAFNSNETLAFEGGIFIEPTDHNISAGTTIKVSNITDLEESLPPGLAPAGAIIEITFNREMRFPIKLLIPINEGNEFKNPGLYCYNEGKNEWSKQYTTLEEGTFLSTVSNCTTFGVLSGEGDLRRIKSLPVPYLHQVHDTNPSRSNKGFNGIFACGPTSTVMILAYFKRLPGKFDTPGEYIYQEYTAFGTTFSQEVYDQNPVEDSILGSKKGKGAWGAMYVPGLGACIIGAMNFLSSHGLDVEAVGVGLPTENQIIEAIKANKIVWGSVEGHIVVVKGFKEYDNQPRKLIIHDPWGDPRKPGWDSYSYYRSKNFCPVAGADLSFTWEELKDYYNNKYGIRNMLIVSDR